MAKRVFLSRFGLVAFALLASSAEALAEGSLPSVFPETISLPNGFQPEGIAVGRGASIYAGSIPTGAIFKANLITGRGAVLVPPRADRRAIGVKVDLRTNIVYVAGGPTGQAYAYDGNTGEDVAVLQLTAESNTFINDQIVTRDAVYFTDSFRPVFYRVPLLPGGRISPDAVAAEIPLGGDFEFVPGEFNANGIVAVPGTRHLLIVSSVGALYRVDRDTGDAVEIDLGGDTLEGGDGLLLRGEDLFVVQNPFDQVVAVELDRGLDSGEIERIITDSRFDIPTTIAGFGGLLYIVNARFSTPPTPETTYTIERIRRGRP